MAPRLDVIAVVLLLAGCAPHTTASAQASFRAEAIEGRVVDADTGQPLEGVVAVANWEIKGGLEGGVPIGELQILEAVTDANGRYFFPAWGPKSIPPMGELDQYAPTLWLFKQGYRPEGFSSLSLGEKPIRLEPFRGSLAEYAEALASLSSSLRSIGFEVGFKGGDYCAWQSFPQMLRALDKVEVEFRAAGVNRGTVVSFLKRNDALIQKQGCRSVFSVLEGSAK